MSQTSKESRPDKLDRIVDISTFYSWLDEEYMSYAYSFSVMSTEEILSFIAYIIKRCREAMG